MSQSIPSGSVPRKRTAREISASSKRTRQRAASPSFDTLPEPDSDADSSTSELEQPHLLPLQLLTPEDIYAAAVLQANREAREFQPTDFRPNARRGAQTAELRQENVDHAARYQKILDDSATCLMDEYEERCENAAELSDDDIIPWIVEYERQKSFRAPLRADTLALLKSKPRTLKYLVDRARNPVTTDPKDYPDIAREIQPDNVNAFARDGIQRYYVLVSRLRADTIPQRQKDFAEKYPATSYRTGPFQLEVASRLEEQGQGDFNAINDYFGTTYRPLEERKEEHDADNNPSLMKKWSELLPKLTLHMYWLFELDTRLQGDATMTLLARYRISDMAADIEEMLVDIGRPISWNVAFGGFAGPRVTRIPNEDEHLMENVSIQSVVQGCWLILSQVRTAHPHYRPVDVNSRQYNTFGFVLQHFFKLATITCSNRVASKPVPTVLLRQSTAPSR